MEVYACVCLCVLGCIGGGYVDGVCVDGWKVVCGWVCVGEGGYVWARVDVWVDECECGCGCVI